MADGQEEKKEIGTDYQLKLTFTSEGLERLRRVQSLGGGLTEAAALANGLAFYEWYLEQVQKGTTLWTKECGRGALIEASFFFGR